MSSNRHKRVARWRKSRKANRGTADCPRMIVHRSNRGIQVHLMDDATGVMICGVSSHANGLDVKGSDSESAAVVGKEVARKALEKGIESVVFDRNGYVYHGRVKALADGAREGGLKF